jgi:hypothetical protein
MKSTEKMYKKELNKKQTPRQLIEGSERPPAWINDLMGNLMGQVNIFIAEEMLKAKQKPEEEIKVAAEKNIEEVEENQE